MATGFTNNWEKRVIEPSDVLEFWFGPEGVVDDHTARSQLWFTPSTEFDDQIRTQFGKAIQSAMTGELSHWCASPEGTLGLVLLLDQFTRNVFRGSAKAFQADSLTVTLVREAIDRKHDRVLDPVRRSFLYLPLEHSEDLEDQKQCVELFTQLEQECAGTDLEKAAQVWLSYAVDHFVIIERFGRFPHRNALLGRSSTPEEVSYLNDDAPTFGQGG